MSLILRPHSMPAGSALNRRQFGSLGATALVALVLSACGDSTSAGAGDTSLPSTGPGSAPGGTTPPANAMSTLSRVTADPTLAKIIADATTQFGVDTYAATAAAEGGNLLLSPVSIAIALAMTRAGVMGPTGTEMDSVLHLGGIADPHAGWNALDQLLESHSGTITHNGEDLEIALSVVNRLWGQTGLAFEQPFLDLLAEQYGAGMHLVDYVDATEAARTVINEWVSDETNVKIPELVKPDVLDPDTRLVLTNAVYFKAPWSTAFEDSTTDADFTLLDGTAVTTPTMRVTETMRYAEGDGWESVDIPYAGNGLAMTVVVPKPTRFGEVEAQLSADVFAVIDQSERYPQVNLTLPKFTFRTALSMAETLKTLGMPTAFTTKADFSAMTQEGQLHVSDVVHEAYIAIDEAGTEAAAATAVVVAYASSTASTDIVNLDVNRPFMIAIRERTTGVPIFLGRVVDPRTE